MNKYRGYQELYADNWNALVHCVFDELNPCEVIKNLKTDYFGGRSIIRKNVNGKSYFLVEDLESKEKVKIFNGVQNKYGVSYAYLCFIFSRGQMIYDKKIKIIRKVKSVYRYTVLDFENNKFFRGTQTQIAKIIDVKSKDVPIYYKKHTIIQNRYKIIKRI